MRIHILSLFGESMRPYLDHSIMKKAQEIGLFQYTIYNLALWSVKNTKRVDDRPYGGGAGTIITVEPLTLAIRDILHKYATSTNIPIFYTSPQGALLTQKHIQTYAQTIEECIIICGHYEGIDARIFDIFPIQQISIGEYVVSSGEIASLVFIDSMVRLIPGVLSSQSLTEESYSDALDGKKEYPQYSRPQVFENLAVPNVLVSGNTSEIIKWQKQNLQ